MEKRFFRSILGKPIEMRDNPYREDREALKELLQQYQNLKSGRQHSFIEEDAFERIIDYYDEKDDINEALEAAETGLEQYPYSSQLMIKKADLLLASKIPGSTGCIRERRVI